MNGSEGHAKSCMSARKVRARSRGKSRLADQRGQDVLRRQLTPAERREAGLHQQGQAGLLPRRHGADVPVICFEKLVRLFECGRGEITAKP